MLYPTIEPNLPLLREALRQQEASLPGFVFAEFEDYLRCGLLDHGIVRVTCNGCRPEHLVAFSCKRRGFCLSCGARRMDRYHPSGRAHCKHWCAHRCRHARTTIRAFCLDRRSVNSTGQIVCQLKNLFRDGTTHVLLNLADFIARLPVLVPRPRANHPRYHGVFAPSYPFRPHIVPDADQPRRPNCKSDNTPPDQPSDDEHTQVHCTTDISESPAAPLSWAQRRVTCH